MDFWNRFSYVGLVCYTQYKDRIDEITPELKRVGLLNKVHFHYDFPSIYRERLYKTCGMSKYNSKGGSFFMGVNHYNVIKTAFELGHESVLVMEDDIRFLKDISLIEDIVSTMPEKYDLVLFDRSKPGDETESEFIYDAQKRAISKYWRQYDKASSCGMYSLSRQGMEHYIDIIENAVRNDNIRNSDFYFKRRWNGEVYWDNTHGLFFSYPNVAVQCIAGKKGSHCDMEVYWNRNALVGLNQEDYMMKPVITSTTFLSKLYEAANRKVNEEAKLTTDSGKLGFCRCGLNKIIPSVFKEMEISDSFSSGIYDWCFIWGNGNTKKNIDSLQMAYRDEAPIVFCEDGFIRSYDTFVNNAIEWKYRQTHSLIYDTKAYYFDATRISTVEKMLNDEYLVISPEETFVAKTLIERIVSNKISKYNHQPIFSPKIGRDGTRKVLVVDQSYGDFSIKRGMADDSTFEKMLQAAITENPDADILVKTHPDTLAGKKAEKKGYYQDLKEHDNIYKVTFPINPYSLLEVCDKVYVCSSQFGFEALMAGKEVHVFGMPFYAGWGLTIDDQHLDRRTNMRTLEELFYIFYCMYTHWVDPDKGCETTIDAVIDKMIKLREEYQKNPHAMMNAIPAQSSDDDGFGYVRCTPPIRKQGIQQQTPTITTRSSVKVLPRIGSRKRGYSNW